LVFAREQFVNLHSRKRPEPFN